MSTFTRQQYMANECSHEEYYGQFVTSVLVDCVVVSIGRDKLLASRDGHLDDIPLAEWDRLANSMASIFNSKLKKVGDFYSLGNGVCICKAAARQFINAHKEIAACAP